MEEKLYDVVIVGSGPAGLSAGIYTARGALKTVLLTGEQTGGQCTITTVMENYPGFPKGIGGVKLMMEMMEQAKRMGVEIRSGVVVKVEKTTETFWVELRNGEKLKARAIIVATGAQTKWLGLPKEKELIGKGVSGCATCDGAFYKEKTVAVIGGGNSACEEAMFLSKLTKKVYLIHRRDELRATKADQKRVFDNPKIEVLWNMEVIKINSNNQITSIPNNNQLPISQNTNEKLESLTIKNIQTGEERVVPVDGMFVAIGRTPATEWLKGTVELKESGHVVVGKNPEYVTMTSREGIFAAGDCVNEVHRQAVVAAGDGAKAALDVERWLEK